LRNEQRFFFHTRDRAHAPVLPRPQDIPGIRKHARHPDRARLRIHISIREIKLAFLWIRHPVSEY
jgi:hypothetical protein